MPLEFPSDWRFNRGAFMVPQEAKDAFDRLFSQIASRAPDRQSVFETVKQRFGNSVHSSDPGWAHTDMLSAMADLMDSAPEFAEAIWFSIEDLREAGHPVPTLLVLNQIFARTKLGFMLDPPSVIPLTSFAPPGADSAAQASASYSRGERLGAGAYGEVYSASRPSPFGAFEFALKIHSPSVFLVSPEKARERFRREVAAVRQLQHRGIVSYLDAGIGPNGELFLAMPRVVGRNIFEATTAWDEGRAIRYLIEVLSAVEYAHSQGVLHRDLKPSNIIVRTSDDQPMLLDFGQAYLLEEAVEAGLSTRAPGTPGYIPIEVSLNPRLRTPQHDVFSCGVLFYEMLSRLKPFDEQATYVPLRSRNEQIRKDMDDFVKKAVAPAPARYKTASEMLADLQALARKRR